MKTDKFILYLIVGLLSMFFLSCKIEQPDEKIKATRLLENGYRLPEATEENMQRLINFAKANMVFVEGGSFMMGDQGRMYTNKEGKTYLRYWSYWRNTKPAHKVILDSYSISKYEVSYWEYDLYTDANGKKPVQKRAGHTYIRQGNYPASVTWENARSYCLWLTEITGEPFDLPTEAQWEYAARNRGENIPFATDNGHMDLNRNIKKRGDTKLKPVGTFPSNPLGLHEMSGNVLEWVYDWYDAEYYKKSPVQNPKGPASGDKKILRGGSMLGDPESNNVYDRYDESVDSLKEFEKKYGGAPYYFGFRCAVNKPTPLTD